jgi:hypothetical protein
MNLKKIIDCNLNIYPTNHYKSDNEAELKSIQYTQKNLYLNLIWEILQGIHLK